MAFVGICIAMGGLVSISVIGMKIATPLLMLFGSCWVGTGMAICSGRFNNWTL
jgi:hypothetical protein